MNVPPHAADAAETAAPRPTSADVVRARQRIRGLTVRTPLVSARRLGEEAGVRLFLKAENLQRTGSFKLRGAVNRIAVLASSGRVVRGVITASSGNHGQALAYAARAFGYPAVVVMPEDAAPPKVAAARAFGAEVIHHGRTSAERFERAHALAHERGLEFVPPYDDVHIIAGQGTIGWEILEDCPEVDAVLVPLGGGGLLAGIATAVKARAAHVRVVGVEPEGSNAHQQSRAAGRIVTLERTETVADGLRKLAPGLLTFPIIQEQVDEIVTVSDDEILHAMACLAVWTKLVVEPSGAVGVAAALAGRGVRPGERVVCVLSGGNVDPAVLARALAAPRG
ncbi:MAG: pyridoxal-phosphate dependent enzyme [Firmicutes bacterium]|nr:pyridoxal-phosphate dependent enzyme [Bacillota bacterium]